MNNLHISLTDFKNESRVLKETESMLNYNIVNKVYIASIHSEGLDEYKIYSDNLELKRFKLITKKAGKNIFIQSFKYLEFFIRLMLFYKNKDIKIINIHSVSLLPLGVLLKYIYSAKLVYDTHELETETVVCYGFRQKILKIIERALIKKCDIIFVVSNGIAKWYADAYNIRMPVVLLNAPKLFNQVKTDYFRNELNIKKHSKILLYQGGLSHGRGVKFLLEIFLKKELDDVVIVFMGYGELEYDIIHASGYKNNIFFYPAVAPEIVLEYTSSADIGISFIENTCLNEYFCLPNKLFEYAMAGLPVIVSNLKEMRDVVERYNMGIVIKYEALDSISDAIDKIVALDTDQMRKNARKFAEDSSWEKQELIMISEYERVLNEK